MCRSAKAGIGVLLAGFLVSCGTEADRGSLPDGPAFDSSTASPAYNAPPNYRQLVARELALKPGYRVHSATISKPTYRWGGLLGGGVRHLVCATTTIDGWLWPQTTRWLVMFEDGKVYGVKANPPAIYCLNVDEEPFPEMLREPPLRSR